MTRTSPWGMNCAAHCTSSGCRRCRTTTWGGTAGGDLHAAIGRDGAGNACLNAIGYLEKWGYTGEQAYLILGTSPIEGRIGGVVDIPNACCSVFLPTGIVDGDIRPGGQGPQRRDRGQVCVTS